LVDVRSKFVSIPDRRKRELQAAVESVVGVSLDSLQRDNGRVTVKLWIEASSTDVAKKRALRAVERWLRGPGAGWLVDDPAEW
jgi:hypothetical protein